jgi:ubiquinone biosynthesis protein
MSAISLFGNLERTRQISTVLVKHGFGEILSRIGLGSLRRKEDEEKAPKISFAQRLRLVLQELGPSFIKLGQIISTRPDLIPADIFEEMKKLQDDVPPVPFEEIKPVIETELGGTLDELFEEFQPKPLASASIGQVHRAKLRLGADTLVEVVIKVQRPNIRATIERDLELLYTFARLVERFIPESRLYAPVGLVREFDRTIIAELDFLAEADNAERFARNFAKNPQVRFPQIYRERTGKKVLTMEFLDGLKITEAAKQGVSGEAIARAALAAIAQMIFEDGLFHADPHPGNLLVLRPFDGPVVLGLLDLGLVGRLNERMQDATIDLMAAAIRQDVDALTDALLAIGKPQESIDKDALRSLVGTVSQKYLGRPLKEIEVSAMIRDLIDGGKQFRVEMPTELVMMGKALMTVEGIGKELYPDLDVYTELKPYFLKLVWRRYNPEKLGREALRGLGQLNRLAINLPDQLHTILEDLRRGRLALKTQDIEHPATTDRLGRRLFSGMIVASLVIAGGLAWQDDSTLGGWLFAVAFFVFVVHALRDFLRSSAP